MRQVWRCLWATDDQLRAWREHGTPVVTAEQMDRNMTGAYEEGLKRGEQVGRRGLRQDIEDGRVDPIRPTVGNTTNPEVAVDA